MATVGAIPAASESWRQLSPQVRTGVQAQGVDTPLLFRHWFDRTWEEAGELVGELGGVSADVDLLCGIWVSVRAAAQAERRREAKSNNHEAAAQVASTLRKRGQAVSMFVTEASSMTTDGIHIWPVGRLKALRI